MKVSKSTKIWHVNKGGFLTVTLDYQRCTSVGQGGGAMLHGGVRSTHEYHLITKSKYSAKRGYFRSSLWCTADADWFSAREIHWNVVCQKRVFQFITLEYRRCSSVVREAEQCYIIIIIIDRFYIALYMEVLQERMKALLFPKSEFSVRIKGYFRWSL